MFGSFCIRSGKSCIQILAGALILGPITMGMIILAVCEIKYQGIQSINYICAEIVCIKVISTLFLILGGRGGGGPLESAMYRYYEKMLRNGH